MDEVAFPSGDEAAFCEMAVRLGIGSLTFVYPFGKHPSSLPKCGVPVRVGVVCSPQQVGDAKRRGLIVFVQSSGADRSVLERNPPPDVVFCLERVGLKDKLHRRVSNLDRSLARLYAERGVAIGVSVSDILAASPRSRAILLGRVRQNLVLARKAGVRVMFSSFARNPWDLRGSHDLDSLRRSLGG